MEGADVPFVQLLFSLARARPGTDPLQDRMMLSGVPIIVLLAAQSAQPVGGPPAPVSVAATGEAGYGPALPSPPRPVPKPAADGCKTPEPKDVTEDTREIVVCAQKPEGYRIDPDVLEAERAKKKGRAGGKRPPEKYVDNSCASVGPMGCRGVPAIDLLGTALVLAEIAQKAASGEDVGKVFETQPQSSDYQRYLDAKREREAREAEQAAAAYAREAAGRSSGEPSR